MATNDIKILKLDAAGIWQEVNLTGVANQVIGFDGSVSPVMVGAASTTASGIVEIAIGSEVDTGTDDIRAVSPKAINDSHNVPSVAPGTSGNIMTSNGTDWTSAAASGGGFDPTTTVEIMEDFVGGNTTSPAIGQNGWTSVLSGGSIDQVNAVSGKIGVVSVITGATTSNYAVLGLRNVNGAEFVLGNQGNVICIISGKNGQSASANTSIKLGMIEAFGGGDPGEGLFFRANGTGNWFAVTVKVGTETTTDTGVAQSTSFKQFKIVTNSAGTSIEYFIDGVSKATHTTNIPTLKISPRFGILTNANVSYEFHVDYAYLKVTGLTR